MIIASNRPFPNRQATNPEELNKYLYLDTPKQIFFPYWSWKVPNEILTSHTCIGFHTGNINGGSPLQNLIRLGVEHSFIRMFEMNSEIDGGKDICKIPICLCGTLEEIIIRQTKIMEEMINEFQKNTE
jgi:methionyl-tRNA formyltransferase